MLYAGLVVSGGLTAGGCSSEGVVSSPVVRVDLRDRLPRNLQRQIAAADTSYPCTRTFTLSEGEASQRFVVNYRVLQGEQAQHITAVEVVPDGPTEGARGPKASAMVGELRLQEDGSKEVAEVPVRISWSATSGCSRISRTRIMTLRADAPDCKPPAPGKKLLSPEP
jgi:hypothetical protein